MTGNLAIQLTTPLLLRKPCKLFASVARVCQRQLGLLVTSLAVRLSLSLHLPVGLLETLLPYAKWQNGRNLHDEPHELTELNTVELTLCSLFFASILLLLCICVTFSRLHFVAVVWCSA